MGSNDAKSREDGRPDMSNRHGWSEGGRQDHRCSSRLWGAPWWVPGSAQRESGVEHQGRKRVCRDHVRLGADWEVHTCEGLDQDDSFDGREEGGGEMAT